MYSCVGAKRSNPETFTIQTLPYSICPILFSFCPLSSLGRKGACLEGLVSELSLRSSVWWHLSQREQRVFHESVLAESSTVGIGAIVSPLVLYPKQAQCSFVYFPSNMRGLASACALPLNCGSLFGILNLRCIV